MCGSVKDTEENQFLEMDSHSFHTESKKKGMWSFYGYRDPKRETIEAKRARERAERADQALLQGLRNTGRAVYDWTKEKANRFLEYQRNQADAEKEYYTGNMTRRAIEYGRREDAFYNLASRVTVFPTDEQMGVPTLLRGGRYIPSDYLQDAARQQRRLAQARMLGGVYQRGTRKNYNRRPHKTYYYRKNYYFTRPRFYLKKRRFFKKKRYYRRRRFNKF